MHTDTATAVWPGPSTEDEVRANVARRTRVLRRRRTIPLAAVPVAALVLTVALALPNAGMRLSTEQRPADSGTTESPAESTTTTTAPGHVVVSDDPRIEATVRPPEYVSVAGKKVPVAPREGTPVPTTGHPVLEDPLGDGSFPDGKGGWRSDPAGDISAVDVTADSTSLTTTLVVPQIATPFLRSFQGEATTAHYQALLYHGDGWFVFRARRDIATGTVTFQTYYQRTFVGVDRNGTYQNWNVANSVGAIDWSTGEVSFSADLADLNAALTQAGEPALGLGTPVRPEGDVIVSYEGVGANFSGTDTAYFSNPDEVYRLGD